MIVSPKLIMLYLLEQIRIHGGSIVSYTRFPSVKTKSHDLWGFPYGVWYHRVGDGSLECCGLQVWASNGLKCFRHIPSILNLIWMWEIWRSQWPFKAVCVVSQRAALAGVVWGLQGYLGRYFALLSIHMNARIEGFTTALFQGDQWSIHFNC